jgi:hypothetical protein
MGVQNGMGCVGMYQRGRRCSVEVAGYVVLLVGDADVAWLSWER